VGGYDLAKPLPNGLTTAQVLASYVGCTPSRCPSKWDQASPLTAAKSGSAPTLIINSTDELVPLSDAEEYGARLDSLFVAEQEDIIPGTRHGSQLTDDAWPQVMAFLNSYLK
jgi:hypothetical protein